MQKSLNFWGLIVREEIGRLLGMRKFTCEKLERVWKNHLNYLKEFVKIVREQGVEKWVEMLEKRYKKGKDFLGREVYKR